MPTYISLIQYTQKGMEKIKESPARLDHAKKGYEAAGGKIKEFYLVMGASTVAALFIDFCGIDTMRALFWTAVINGFLSPPLQTVSFNEPRIPPGRISCGGALLGWRCTSLLLPG